MATAPVLCSDRGVQPVQALFVEASGGGETKMRFHGVAVARGVFAGDSDVGGEVSAIRRDCQVERSAPTSSVADPLAGDSMTNR